MSTSQPTKWGPILIVGGSGRLGYFIAKHLLEQPECTTVVSISRSSKVAHRCMGVDYRVADIQHATSLLNVLLDVQPETIINCAAPAHTDTATPASEFEKVFVTGQDTLMTLAQQVGSTRYMICTTSSSVIAGYNHVQADETAPLWAEDASAFPYWVQRARAERRLLAADSAVFQTVSLRLPLIIGEREYAFIPAMLNTLEEGNTGVQIGGDRGLLATVSAGDAARAHVLALKALIRPRNGVHGETFFITGKKDLSFWSMAKIIWEEAGWKQDKPPFMMPEWVAWLVAFLGEWIMWPFGVEPQLTRHMVRFMCHTWTYNGSKARERLGYEPQDDTEEELRKGVRWHLAKKTK
ncbi:uncharacterized protein BDV14DRAFT_199569 [Aspergillus stella-maris]|uniref:uncharacterized protein n=1 Tax=Aspergillus stella-maris TaxID=1810926 RepID=UPI003CCD1392